MLDLLYYIVMAVGIVVVGSAVIKAALAFLDALIPILMEAVKLVCIIALAVGGFLFLTRLLSGLY